MSDPAARHIAEDAAADTAADELETVEPDRSSLPPLRDYNVFATFTDPETARDAILALERAGIDGANVSALALDLTDRADASDETSARDAELVDELGTSVGHGAAIGAVAGALGSAAIALAIPGVGAALGAGILAVAAGGAMAGTGVGGFAGAVSGTPASKGWEQALIDLDSGRVVIGVHHDDQETHDTAMSHLAGAGAVSIREIDSDGRSR